eukprot:42910-Prymnesium_polylepis.1
MLEKFVCEEHVHRYAGCARARVVCVAGSSARCPPTAGTASSRATHSCQVRTSFIRRTPSSSTPRVSHSHPIVGAIGTPRIVIACATQVR